MELWVNGLSEPLEQSISLMDYLIKAELPLEQLVVEHNRRIIPAEQYQSQLLNDQDRIEILRLVGGG
jgi:sulfur carrier protein